MKDLIINVPDEAIGKRADIFLSEELDGYSRSFLKKYFDNGEILVNEKPVKAGYKLRIDDRLQASIPDSIVPDILPENIPLDILYEDEDLLIVNKPQGMVVHPAAGHYSGTLVNALMYYCKDQLSGINGVLRPGIVHRIDKNTSGSLLVCKNDESHRIMAERLAVHDIDRKYRAIIHGRLPEEKMTIDKPIGRNKNDRKKMAVTPDGKRAVTHIEVLEEYAQFSYVECTLETGRTHQIRVHLSSVGHPILGDDTYGPDKCPFKGLKGQTLHAYHLGFEHPKKYTFIAVDAPIPAYFLRLLNLCKV